MDPVKQLFRWTVVWLAAAVALLAPSVRADHVDPNDIITVLAPDAIPAITDPSFERDSPDWLPADARVVGLAVEGDARAYPLAIMSWHEIVDDVVGGRLVAVTYCPLCGTGIVYDRGVGSDGLVFKVSGKLYKNDLVMYDTATQSLWSQLLGNGILGAYHGSSLELLTSATIGWSEWRSLHPDTRLLDRPRDASGSFLRDYSRNPYAGYENSPEVYFPQGNVDPYKVLDPKEPVLGVFLGNEARAYPQSVLAKELVVNDVLGGVPILVTDAGGVMKAWERGSRTFHAAGETVVEDEAGNAYDMMTGSGNSGDLAEVPAVTSFWFAWYDFYPSTSIYGFLDLLPQPPLKPAGAPPVAFALPAVAIVVGVVLWARRRFRRRE